MSDGLLSTGRKGEKEIEETQRQRVMAERQVE